MGRTEGGMRDEDMNTTVCAAMNTKTGEYESFCLTLHSDYPEWKISMEAIGLAICQMTVLEAVKFIGGANEPRH